MSDKPAGRPWRPAVAPALNPEDRLVGIKRDLSAAAEAAAERLRAGTIGYRKVQAYRAAEMDLNRTQRELRCIVRNTLDEGDLARFCQAHQAKKEALIRARHFCIEIDNAQFALRRARRWREKVSAMDAARAARRANGAALMAAERAAATLREIADRFNARLCPEHKGVIESRRNACETFIEAARRVINARDTRCPKAEAVSNNRGATQ